MYMRAISEDVDVKKVATVIPEVLKLTRKHIKFGNKYISRRDLNLSRRIFFGDVQQPRHTVYSENHFAYSFLTYKFAVNM